MSLSSSRRKNKPNKDSVYREVSSDRFIAIRTVNEIEDLIDTSEAYMTDPTVIFNSDNTKVLFYYDTKNKNEIEEMETLFKRTVKPKSTITLSDASYLDESSGDDTMYDISGTYRFEKYDANTKTIVASPISVNKQSTTYLTYNSKYWLGSLLWTTSDAITTRTTSYEIVNFVGNSSDQSFTKVLGPIQPNDKIEVVGLGTFTVLNFTVDSDEGWERIKVKEEIPEKDYLGELTFIRLLRSGMKKKRASGGPKTKNQSTPSAKSDSQPIVSNRTKNPSSYVEPPPPILNSTDMNILKNVARESINLNNPLEGLSTLGMSRKGIENLVEARNSIQEKSRAYAASKRQKQQEEYEQTPKDKAKEAWLSSGSKTLNVTVVSTLNGNKFSINGDDPNEVLELHVGDTVLIKQSNKSNGSSGFTRTNHPLRFSIIEDGVHRGGSASSIDYVSNKSVGNNGSYYYFTVPSVGKLFYYCENHPGMGKQLVVSRIKQGACCIPDESCSPGDLNGPRKCYMRSRYRCTGDGQLGGVWHKDKKCKKRKGGGTMCCDSEWEPDVPPSSTMGADPDDVITGACCMGSGDCLNLSKHNCKQFEGTFVGGKCKKNTCTSYTLGACCDKCNCVETKKGDCPGSKDWLEGKKCAKPGPTPGINPCCPPDDTEPIPCCMRQTAHTICHPRRRCIMKTELQCIQDGGIKLSGATSCPANSCCPAGDEPLTQTTGFETNAPDGPIIGKPGRVGACCFTDTCLETPEENCGLYGGIFMGGNCDSSPNPCKDLKEGACCTIPVNDDEECECTTTNLADCPNGSWMSDSTCPSHPNGINPCCPQDNKEKGRCCWGANCNGYPNVPRCNNLTAYECANRRGTWSSGSCSGEQCCEPPGPET